MADKKETERFVDNGDGTVTDTMKDLMWMKNDTWVDLQHLVSWDQSQDYINEMNAQKFAGYDDWRIPSSTAAKELYDPDYSNVDVDGCEIHIPSIFPPGSGYTTWTTDTRGAKSAMGYDYRSDYEFWLAKNNVGFPSSVRPVRIVKKKSSLDYTERYQDNGDGTINDLETGLMWKKDDSYLDMDKWLTWDESKTFIKMLNEDSFADYEDWRMPTRIEAMAIYDGSSPLKDAFGDVIHLPPVFPPGAGQSTWTKTLHKTDPKLAMRVNYFSGDYKWYKQGLKSHGVRPVRKFQTAEPDG